MPLNTHTLVPLDKHDAKILAELQADARLSMTALGRRVHLSAPAVTERVRKLEQAGVITGYRATVQPEALGYGIRAVMRVGRSDYAKVVKAVAASPDVVRAYNVTGDDSWIIEIAVIDVAHLDAVVSKFCAWADTSTAIVLNVPREHHALRPAQREPAMVSVKPK
jgi:Lrp/AsnC family transcriptional regulator, leucine-responsive regulatory protein